MYPRNFQDTIEIKKISGSKAYFLNGIQINPYSKTSVLKQFPESNQEYLIARKHRSNAWKFLGSGAAVFFSASIFKNDNVKNPLMIGGGVICSLAWFQIPKMTKHIRNSVIIYNEKIREINK